MPKFFQLGSGAALTSGKNVSFPVLYNQTAWSIMFWFNHQTVNGAGGTIYRLASGTGNSVARVDLQFDATGHVFFRIRTASTNFEVTSSAAYLDAVWHRCLFVRRSSGTFQELYIDGVSAASSTTDPGTDATAVAYWTIGGINATNAAGVALARFGVVSGASLSSAEADLFLFGGSYNGRLSQWIEMNSLAAAEPDLSGNGADGLEVQGATQILMGGQVPLFSPDPPMAPINRGTIPYRPRLRRFAPAAAATFKAAWARGSNQLIGSGQYV